MKNIEARNDMKLGKVSDTILSRSVLKPLNTVRGQKVTRMDIGQDVSEVDIREQGVDKTLLSATACGMEMDIRMD